MWNRYCETSWSRIPHRTPANVCISYSSVGRRVGRSNIIIFKVDEIHVKNRSGRRVVYASSFWTLPRGRYNNHYINTIRTSSTTLKCRPGKTARKLDRPLVRGCTFDITYGFTVMTLIRLLNVLFPSRLIIIVSSRTLCKLGRIHVVCVSKHNESFPVVLL